MKRSLFGYEFVNLPFDLFFKSLPSELAKSKFQWCMTLNPEIVVGALDKPDVQAFMKRGLCVADGTGLRLAYYGIYRKKLEKITGLDLVFRLLAEEKFSFYLVGGTPEVISQAVSTVQKRYPQSPLLGWHHGYFSEAEESQILKDIVEKKPDFILAGLGFPKQERFLNKLSQSATHGIGIGVGGVFNVISGDKMKAPSVLRKCGLEWLFQGLVEPKRMKRWGFIPRFLWLAFRETSF